MHFNCMPNAKYELGHQHDPVSRFSLCLCRTHPLNLCTIGNLTVIGQGPGRATASLAPHSLWLCTHKQHLGHKCVPYPHNWITFTCSQQTDTMGKLMRISTWKSS